MYLDTFQSGKRIVGLLLKCIKCFPNASFEIFRCFVGLAVFGREHGSLLLPSSVHWGTLRWSDTQINTNTKANTNTNTNKKEWQMTDIDLMAVLATVVNHIQRKAAGRRIHCEHTDDSLF